MVLRDYAQAVEGMGYQDIAVYDHVLGADMTHRDPKDYNYTTDNQFHEPFVMLGYLAGLTRSISFTTCVLVLPQRQTALVAKQAAEVDVLSGGRLRLGVGVGWNAVEYEALNKDFSNRRQAHPRTDRRPAGALDAGSGHFPRRLAPHPRGRHQPAAGATPDPRLGWAAVRSPCCGA